MIGSNRWISAVLEPEKCQSNPATRAEALIVFQRQRGWWQIPNGRGGARGLGRLTPNLPRIHLIKMFHFFNKGGCLEKKKKTSASSSLSWGFMQERVQQQILVWSKRHIAQDYCPGGLSLWFLAFLSKANLAPSHFDSTCHKWRIIF